jgi:outer membrane protein assembly factor BamB
VNLPFFACLLPALLLGPADDPVWPDYRGPNHDGHAPADARLALDWSEEANVIWKRAIWGRGWSSPVVAEGRVWLTTADSAGERLAVLCFDVASGKRLLDRTLFEVVAPQHRNKLNSYASPSPVVEAGRVYLFFGNEGLVCLDSGNFEELWRRTDLNCDHMEGPGSSPLLLADRLIVHVDGGDVQYVCAIATATGKTLWKTARGLDLKPFIPDMRKAYSTPVPVRRDARTVLVSSGAQATYGYDAENGRELWRVRHGGFSMSSRPVIHGDLAIISTGFMRPELWAIRLGGEGDVTETHVVWKATRGAATMPSPVLVGGLLFVVSDGGVLTCLNPDDGDELGRQRLADRTCASLLAAGQRIYQFDTAGLTAVVSADEQLELLGSGQLDEGCMATPAVIGDALILRTKTHLYRIETSSED